MLENIHRAVNIGLVNELKTLDRMGIDLYEVIRAATKPFGFVPYFQVLVWEVTVFQLIPSILHERVSMECIPVLLSLREN